MTPRTALQKRILESLRRLPLDARGAAYLESRGLSSVAEELGFGVVPDSIAANLRQYRGRLVIPSIGPSGNVYDVAFRCLFDHDCKAADCAKYLFLPGLDKRLYNLQALSTAGTTIEITEGQLDAASLVACGLHAIGVPGVNGWKGHHHRLFQGYDRVRVWGDGDVAGKAFAEKVANSVAGAEVMMVNWEMDVNTTLITQGRDAILKIAEGEPEDDAEDDGWGLEREPDQPAWEHDSERPPF